MQQYPCDFEYSSSFVTIFAQASYSGYFTTFRGNCESDRNSLMRRVAPLEDMSLSEMQFSSVFYYIYMLLKCELFSSLLVNPFYAPPSAANGSVHYLRPRTAVVDLSLWRDGLAGFNKQIFEVSMGVQHPGVQECIAVSANVNAR